MKAISVKASPGYKLNIAFEDGVAGTIDLEYFVQHGVFATLKDEQKFEKVYITDYSLAWNEELEIDLMAVYAELSCVETNV